MSDQLADWWGQVVTHLVEGGLTEEQAIQAVMYAQARGEAQEVDSYNLALQCLADEESPLWRMFVWSSTPEGLRYWNRLAVNWSKTCK